MATLSWQLAGSDDLARLREHATAALTGARASRQHVQQVVLTMTELATNALRHAPGPHQTVVVVEDGFTLVRVSDGGGGDAVIAPSPSEAGGFGLRVVDAMAQAWGSVPTDSGKVVWAVLVDAPNEPLTDHDDSRLQAVLASLEESRARMEVAQRLTHFGTFDLDLATGVLEFSDEMHRICGLDPVLDPVREIADVLPLLDYDAADRIPEIIQQASSSLDPIEAEFSMVRPDGERRVVELLIESVSDDAGVRRALRGTALDVTDSHRHLTELRAQRQALEEAQRLAQLGSWHYDLRNDAAVWSPQMYALFGRDESAGPMPVGSCPASVHPDDGGRVRDARRQALRDRRRFSYEARMRRGDGTEWLASVHGEPILGPEREVVAVHGTVQDLTARRAAELALARSEAERAAQRAAINALQQSVLPPSLPKGDAFEFAARYEPAGHETLFGGDWYDAFPVGGGRIVVALGDVAGHGLDAAAMMVQLRNATRAYTIQNLSPAATLTALDTLVQSLYPNEMATMVLAIYDPARRTVSIARAGHPHPVLHSVGRPARVLELPVGLPIGAGHSAALPYVDTHLDLEEADRLLLYSDGCVEQRGRTFAEGIRDLLAVVEASAGTADLCDRVVALRPAGVDDDRCVLALHVHR